MSHDNHNSQPDEGPWAGLDWGTQTHACCVVSPDFKPLDDFIIGDSLEDIKTLIKRLKAVPGLKGIAVETTREAVVGFLLEAGLTVYPINPKLSKSWRDCNSVAGVKSDERDSYVLAMELARRHNELRPIKPCDPAAQELAGLCRELRKNVSSRTRLVQGLKATLRQYFRGALDFFGDWTSPVAWRFLKKFPTPEKLAKAKASTIRCFLKANHIGLKPIWEERIKNRTQATQWPSPHDRLALELSALAKAKELMALQPCIDQFDKLIAERTSQLPQAKLIRSLPGAGKRLAPALTAIVVTMQSEDKDEDLQGLRCLSGIAPVEAKSGKSQCVKRRKRCNKHWRDIFHLFAHCSTTWSPWAKAFYDIHRERGDTHATALRKLADKWVKIIRRMLADNKPYDEDQYVQALKNAGSPVYQKLCG